MTWKEWDNITQKEIQSLQAELEYFQLVHSLSVQGFWNGMEWNEMTCAIVLALSCIDGQKSF